MMKRSDGFSIVEVLVSMVILSIVMLVLTNVTMVSTIGHASARTKDDAQQFAREQLQILLDPSAMVATSSVPIVKQHKGLNYNLSWRVSSEQPPLVTVTASYEKDGKTHSAEVAGYVDSDNVCPDNSDANPPSGVTFYDPSGSVVAEPFVVGNSPANTFIARVIGEDPDAGDIVSVEFQGNAAQNDEFRISRDSLFTKSVMSDLNTNKNIVLEATDCSGRLKVVYATIKVGGVSEKPEVDSPFDAGTVNENVQSGTLGILAPNASDPGGDPIVWTTTDNNFHVDASSGLITVASTANIDYESNSGTYSFIVKATRNDEYTNVTVNVTVQNINENPTIQAAPIAFTIPADALTGEVAGTVTFSDPDGSSAPNNWGNVIVKQFGNSTDFVVMDDGVIRLKAGASISENDVVILTVFAEDDAGLQSDTRDVTINVTAGASTGSGTIPPYDVTLWATYHIDDLVTYNGATWKCITETNRHLAPGNATSAWACIANCP